MEKIKSLNVLYLESNAIANINNKRFINLIVNKLTCVNILQEAIEEYKKNKHDIIIVDNDELDFIEYIRKNDIRTPIIIISSKLEANRLVEYINFQINAYLMNPINLDNLTNCFKNCIKKIEDNQIVNIDRSIVYNITTKELFIEKKQIKLGSKVNKLLHLFIKNQNKVLSKDYLQYSIWNNSQISNSSIKNLIGSLRKIIGKDKICNVPGYGWKLAV